MHCRRATFRQHERQCRVILTFNLFIMQEIIHPSELLHIWKCEPCETGDTLSGGERVANLKRLGLIQATEAGYVTTSKGKRIVQRLIEHLDRLEISLVTDIAVFTPQNFSNLK